MRSDKRPTVQAAPFSPGQTGKPQSGPKHVQRRKRKCEFCEPAQEKLGDDAQAASISVLLRSPFYEAQALNQILPTFVVPSLAAHPLQMDRKFPGPSQSSRPCVLVAWRDRRTCRAWSGCRTVDLSWCFHQQVAELPVSVLKTRSERWYALQLCSARNWTLPINDLRVYPGRSGAKDQNDCNLGSECCTTVENYIAQHSSPRGDKGLMPFIKRGHQGGVRESKRGPLQAP